ADSQPHANAGRTCPRTGNSSVGRGDVGPLIAYLRRGDLRFQAREESDPLRSMARTVRSPWWRSDAARAASMLFLLLRSQRSPSVEGLPPVKPVEATKDRSLSLLEGWWGLSCEAGRPGSRER